MPVQLGLAATLHDAEVADASLSVQVAAVILSVALCSSLLALCLGFFNSNGKKKPPVKPNDSQQADRAQHEVVTNSKTVSEVSQQNRSHHSQEPSVLQAFKDPRDLVSVMVSVRAGSGGLVSQRSGDSTPPNSGSDAPPARLSSPPEPARPPRSVSDITHPPSSARTLPTVDSLVSEATTNSTNSAFTPSDRSTAPMPPRPVSTVQTIPEQDDIRDNGPSAPDGRQLQHDDTLSPRDPSLPALFDFLYLLATATDARAGLERYVVDVNQPVGMGLSCVYCQCATSFGKAVSATFYPSPTDMQRQLELLRMSSLKEFCVDILDELPQADHQDGPTGLKFVRPACIITEATCPVDDVLRNLKDFQRNFTVTAIGCQLAAQLTKLHRRRQDRRMVHHFITRSNVIQLPTTAARVSWSLREYACVVTEGQHVSQACHSNVRLFAPEAGEALRRGLPVTALPAMDVWQLGVLLFELYTGSNYWPAGESDDLVVTALERSLPSERDPSMLNRITRAGAVLKEAEFLITRMLSRDPEARPSMSEVSKKFEEWHARALSTFGTFTAQAPQDMLMEGTIQLVASR